MNSALSLLNAIGGTCRLMCLGMPDREFKKKGGVYVPTAVPKLLRRYRKHYQHCLSDHITEKNQKAKVVHHA